MNALARISDVFYYILPLMIAIFAPIIIIVIKRMVNKYSYRLDLQNSATINNLILELVEQGVNYAEQLAKNKAKAIGEIHGEDKLIIATRYIVDEIRERQICEITSEAIQKKIEAHLGIFAVADQIDKKRREDEDGEQNYYS